MELPGASHTCYLLKGTEAGDSGSIFLGYGAPVQSLRDSSIRPHTTNSGGDSPTSQFRALIQTCPDVRGSAEDEPVNAKKVPIPCGAHGLSMAGPPGPRFGGRRRSRAARSRLRMSSQSRADSDLHKWPDREPGQDQKRQCRRMHRPREALGLRGGLGSQRAGSSCGSHPPAASVSSLERSGPVSWEKTRTREGEHVLRRG